MRQRQAVVAVGCVVCLLVGAVSGRSLGVGDAEASSAYDEAAAAQKHAALQRRIDVLEGELARSKQAREELANSLGERGPALDLAGALETARAEAKQALEDGRKALEKGKTLALGELEQLRREKTRIERNARTESARWREVNTRLQQEVRELRGELKALNSTLKTLKSLPFGR